MTDTPPAGDRPTDHPTSTGKLPTDDGSDKGCSVGLTFDVASDPTPCRWCGRLSDTEPPSCCVPVGEHDAAAALDTILCNLESRDAEKLAAARVLTDLSGWREDPVLVARVRSKFHRNVAAALFDAGRANTSTPAEALVESGADFLAGITPGELVQPVDEAAAGLAYPEHAVLVHSKRGQGKTTLTSWAVAQATRAGRRVLVIGSDDRSTWQQRLCEFDADTDCLGYAPAARLTPRGKLEAAVTAWSPDWIIVDNWRSWGLASGISSDGGFGNTDAAGARAERLVAVARTGPAITIIHNQGHHNDQRSRDSIALEDAVDSTMRIALDGNETTLEPAPDGKVRHRLERRTWRYRLTAAGFALVDAADSPPPTRGGDGGGKPEAPPLTHGGIPVPESARWIMQHGYLHDGSTIPSVMAESGRGKLAVCDGLRALVEAGIATRDGTGRRNDPFRFSVSVSAGGRGLTETETETEYPQAPQNQEVAVKMTDERVESAIRAHNAPPPRIDWSGDGPHAADPEFADVEGAYRMLTGQFTPAMRRALAELPPAVVLEWLVQADGPNSFGSPWPASRRE